MNQNIYKLIVCFVLLNLIACTNKVATTNLTSTNLMETAEISEYICPSCDLHGQDFSGQDLRNANFLNSNLNAANFTNANLDGAVFSNASLNGAIFDGASIKSTAKGPTVFFGADLTNARFDRSIFEGTKFFGANHHGTRYSNTDLSSVLFGPKINYSKEASGIPPLFDNVTMNCEFPWAWEELNIVNTNLPTCEFHKKGSLEKIHDTNYLVEVELIEAAATTIYVSADYGSDNANCGTLENPCQNIKTAVDKCPNGDCNVLVAFGDYYLNDLTIQLKDGVNLYGGYGYDWRPTNYQSTIYSPSSGWPAIRISNSESPASKMSKFIIFGGNADLISTSYGLIIYEGSISLEDVDLNAGKGKNGQNGQNGADGINGVPGLNATSTLGGAAGSSQFVNPGGKGGNLATPSNIEWYPDVNTVQGFPITTCYPISYDADGMKGDDGRSSGTSPARGSSFAGKAWNGDFNPNNLIGYHYNLRNARPGANGTSPKCGAGGLANINNVGIWGDDYWIGYDETGGSGSDGLNGGGGGGGGSGGTCVSCTSKGTKAHKGTPGGGGGSGGQRGLAGTGGFSGGASIGILLVGANSTLITGEQVRITLNSGGSGGNGGNGGRGGSGGIGGKAYNADAICGTSSGTAGQGGDGGNGGNGSSGGGGAGGNSGPSFGVVLNPGSTLLEMNNILFTTGASDEVGKGGASGNCSGQNGIAGLVQDIYQIPPEIGSMINGGIIFYVAQPNEDLNGDGIPDQGFIAAPTDQSSGTNWSPNNNDIPNLQKVESNPPLSGQDLVIGNGANNSSIIVQTYSTSETAAKICADLVIGNNEDWFLPSIGELHLMYTNIGGGAASPFTNYGAFNGNYWSSSPSGYPGAWRENMLNGDQWHNNRTTTITNKIRAISVF